MFNLVTVLIFRCECTVTGKTFLSYLRTISTSLLDLTLLLLGLLLQSLSVGHSDLLFILHPLFAVTESKLTSLLEGGVIIIAEDLVGTIDDTSCDQLVVVEDVITEPVSSLSEPAFFLFFRSIVSLVNSITFYTRISTIGRSVGLLSRIRGGSECSLSSLISLSITYGLSDLTLSIDVSTSFLLVVRQRCDLLLGRSHRIIHDHFVLSHRGFVTFDSLTSSSTSILDPLLFSLFLDSFISCHAGLIFCETYWFSSSDSICSSSSSVSYVLRDSLTE